MKKRILILLAALMISIFAFAACQQADDPAPPAAADPAPPAAADPAAPPAAAPEVAPPETTAQDTMTIVTSNIGVSRDPIASNDSPSAQVNRQLFSTLVRMDYDTFEIIPNLAIDWDMPDARTLNMRIRDDVYFHDGSRLTAHDVKFSLERSSVEPEVAAILGMLDSVAVHDDYNFTVYTEVDFAPILRHLAHTAASIVPQEVVERLGSDAFSEAPIGTGAFMFQDLITGYSLTMVRNPNYWGTPPVIETLIWRQVPEASVRLMAIQTGDADFAIGIDPADIAVAEADPNVVMMRRMNLSTAYLGFNTRAPYLSNPLVRQAINYAMDWDAVVSQVWLGAGAPARGPMAEIVWGFSEQPPFDYNLDRARELLAEAGYPDGFSTTIWYNIPNMQRQQVAEMMQFSLARIGIDIAIEGVEWAQYLSATAAGEHDMFILGWVSVTGDADYGLHPLLHSDLLGPGGNRTFIESEYLDGLLDAGRSEVDPALRLQIYDEVQAYMRQHLPFITIWQGEELHAASPSLRGLVLNPGAHHNYANVWFE